MKIKIKKLFLSMMILLMGIHFQSNVFAHSEHNKDANIIKMAISMLELTTKSVSCVNTK